MLQDVRVDGANGLNEEADEWEEVEMIVDSGASGTVVGANMVRAVEATNIKSDVSYKLADGSRIPHMGEKSFKAFTDQGHIRHMIAAVTDVDDALLSVSKVVSAGNRVVFDNEGSYIEHKESGEVTPLVTQGSLYELKMWVPKNQSHPF